MRKIYKGLCLNTCQLRSGKIIGPDEVRAHGYFQPQADTSLLYVANIFNKDTATNMFAFYVGRIDCRKVSDVIVQIGQRSQHSLQLHNAAMLNDIGSCQKAFSHSK
ncbi:MAG: hypothetical protein JW795_11455 [Chitinivibrionales bacterium]|nr:hypothetical protein [Chitinivibrionales bacterium]